MERELPIMFCCVDVDYRESLTMTACVGFSGWTDAEPRFEKAMSSAGAAPEYEPGAFYLRELPYLLAMLATLDERPELVVIDGYVWLGAERPGLGAHLYEALERRVTVVGVAKRPYLGALAVPVLRGASKQLLYVGAAGVALEEAAEKVRTMHGIHRIPTLLKRVDRLSRDAIPKGTKA